LAVNRINFVSRPDRRSVGRIARERGMKISIC
jgi:hypothetical protein